jgi:hypothetical protein
MSERDRCRVFRINLSLAAELRLQTGASSAALSNRLAITWTPRESERGLRTLLQDATMKLEEYAQLMRFVSPQGQCLVGDLSLVEDARSLRRIIVICVIRKILAFEPHDWLSAHLAQRARARTAACLAAWRARARSRALWRLVGRDALRRACCAWARHAARQAALARHDERLRASLLLVETERTFLRGARGARAARAARARSL